MNMGTETTTPSAQQPKPIAAASNLTPTGCCPPFDPDPWNEKEITWEGNRFVKAHVHSVFHIPLDMGRKVMQSMRLIEAAHATAPHAPMLSEESSPWGSELYINVTGPVPGADVVTISGTFLTKVYEGPFRNASDWAADMGRYVAEKGRTMKKLYFGYTMCPRCAKAYGKNYVVLFARVD
jgi:hypothetical protein